MCEERGEGTEAELGQGEAAVAVTSPHGAQLQAAGGQAGGQDQERGQAALQQVALAWHGIKYNNTLDTTLTSRK